MTRADYSIHDYAGIEDLEDKLIRLIAIPLPLPWRPHVCCNAFLSEAGLWQEDTADPIEGLAHL